MAPTDEAVRDELRRIILSPGFIHSDRLRRFLTYSIEQTLAGNPQNLKEYSIGVEAFDRPKHYSPSEDPIVRVEARRLRRKLDEYYLGPGLSNPVRIELPKGSYVPVFVDRAPLLKTAPEVSRLWITGLIVLLITAMAFGVWAMFRARPSMNANDPQTLTRLTSDAGLTTDPALSADGRWLAYATDRGAPNLNIWIRDLEHAGHDDRRLTTSPADHHQPVVSPRGDWVAFRSESESPGVYVVKASGGEPLLLGKEGRDPQYSPDGSNIAYWVGSPGDDMLVPRGRIFVTPSTGGRESATALQPQLASAACPVWSPDGSRILFLGLNESADKPDWWIAPAMAEGPLVATGAAAILAQSGLALPFRECTASWQPGALIFAARSGDTQNLWRLPIDSSGRARAPLVRLTFGSAAEWRPSATSSGAIVFSSRTSRSRIWKLSGSHDLTPIAASSADATFPSAARDGRAVAFLAGSTGNAQLWWKDLQSGREAPLTRPPTAPRYPQISPDGKQVAFTDYSSNPHKAFIVSTDSQTPEPLPIPPARIWDWTAHLLIYQNEGARHQIEEFDTVTGHSRLLINGSADLAGPRLSPDLHTIAWHAIPSPVRRQLLYAAYPRIHVPAPLLDGDAMDRNCAWSADSRTLYFLSERDGYRCIWKKSVHDVGPPEAVRHFHSAQQSLASFGDVGAIGLSAMPDGLLFALRDSTGNLWMLHSR